MVPDNVPTVDLWYILNATLPPLARDEYEAEDWWKCKDYYAYSQRESCATWLMQDSGVCLPISYVAALDSVVHKGLGVRVGMQHVMQEIFALDDNRMVEVIFLEYNHRPIVRDVVRRMEEAYQKGDHNSLRALLHEFAAGMRGITAGHSSSANNSRI